MKKQWMGFAFQASSKLDEEESALDTNFMNNVHSLIIQNKPMKHVLITDSPVGSRKYCGKYAFNVIISLFLTFCGTCCYFWLDYEIGWECKIC